jgi:hypothetical protein
VPKTDEGRPRVGPADDQHAPEKVEPHGYESLLIRMWIFNGDRAWIPENTDRV